MLCPYGRNELSKVRYTTTTTTQKLDVILHTYSTELNTTLRPRAKGKFRDTDNTKIGIKRGNYYRKN